MARKILTEINGTSEYKRMINTSCFRLSEWYYVLLWVYCALSVRYDISGVVRRGSAIVYRKHIVWPKKITEEAGCNLSVTMVTGKVPTRQLCLHVWVTVMADPPLGSVLHCIVLSEYASRSEVVTLTGQRSCPWQVRRPPWLAPNLRCGWWRVSNTNTFCHFDSFLLCIFRVSFLLVFTMKNNSGQVLFCSSLTISQNNSVYHIWLFVSWNNFEWLYWAVFTSHINSCVAALLVPGCSCHARVFVAIWLFVFGFRDWNFIVKIARFDLSRRCLTVHHSLLIISVVAKKPKFSIWY